MVSDGKQEYRFLDILLGQAVVQDWSILSLMIMRIQSLHMLLLGQSVILPETETYCYSVLLSRDTVSISNEKSQLKSGSLYPQKLCPLPSLQRDCALGEHTYAMNQHTSCS
jgi:hypothetical protein